MISNLHIVTDLLAASSGSLAGFWLYRRYLRPAGLTPPAQADPLYWGVLILSALIGAYLLGTLNLYLSGESGLGRSIFGALMGGILGIELYKKKLGRRESTGGLFVLPLALGLAMGRIGCFLAGLGDFTYGVPTDLPWGWDFGDGIRRHPVQLYESLAMFAFALGFFLWARRFPLAAMRCGFYGFVLYAAILRFLLEFWKPYGRPFGGLTLFQIGAMLLFLYALPMMRRERKAHARD